MRTCYTVAIDGEIGYFETYATRQQAQNVADRFGPLHPDHRYDVVDEMPAQVRYLRVKHALPQ